jgi:transposase
MSKLNGITTEELRAHLQQVEGRTAALRLVVGINYKHGVTPAELAEWYGVTRVTIHNWLKRLERLADESCETVLYDDSRPGRPSKLTDEQRDQLASTLERPPSDLGIDATEWTPETVQTLIVNEFDVTYTPRHVHSLMKELSDR